MIRKKTLIMLGLSMVIMMVMNTMIACEKSNTAPAVDFTIDLTDPKYVTLLNLGGYIYINNIIIANTPVNGYVALWEMCTYGDCNVQFEVSQNDFFCPCCNSHYNIQGNVTLGPALAALFQYSTQKNGSLLRVFSN